MACSAVQDPRPGLQGIVRAGGGVHCDPTLATACKMRACRPNATTNTDIHGLAVETAKSTRNAAALAMLLLNDDYPWISWWVLVRFFAMDIERATRSSCSTSTPAGAAFVRHVHYAGGQVQRSRGWNEYSG